MLFVRPSSLSFPQIYHTFRAKNKAGDAEIEYQIRDLPEELFEEALKMLASDFVTEETMCVGRNVAGNELSLNEVCIFWFGGMDQKITIGCFANDGSDELAGIAVMVVMTKGEDPDDGLDPITEESKDLSVALKWILAQNNVYEKYNVNQYLGDLAMCTRREFRNRGVATELIKARLPMLKALNLKVSSSMYTVIGTQKAAAKAGHHVGYEILYDDLQKKFPTFDFSKSNVNVLKIMDLKIE